MIWHRSLAGGGHSVLGFDPATAETPLKGGRHLPIAWEQAARSRMLTAVEVGPRLERFIRACAGNSRGTTGSPLRPPVHPRVCGEQSVAELVVCAPTGSSPRVRGTGAIPGDSFRIWRFIPACAGNSPLPQIYPAIDAVHPRVCGEQNWFVMCLRSPVRFIPACAGNR